MKKLSLSLAVLAMAGVASAGLVPNGDFENGATSWSSFSDGTTIVSFEATGGAGDNLGYGLLDATAGTWGAGFVSPADNEYPGNDGIPLSFFGLSGGDDITVTMDMKTFSGTSIGGVKLEAWSGGVYLDNFGGDTPASGQSAEWAPYSWDFTLPATTDAIKIVPLLTWNYAPNAGSNVDSVIGFDNVNVVPEPATFGLLGIAGGAMLFLRRRFRV